jgi:fatty-acid desaturase
MKMLSKNKTFFALSTLLVTFALLWTLNSIFIEDNYQLLWLTIPIVVLLSGVESMYYHRFLAHKSWDCPKWLEVIFLTISTGFHFLPAMFWAGGHRKHHRFNDGEGDIQGPTVSVIQNIKLVLGDVIVSPRYMLDMIDNTLLSIQLSFYWLLLIIFGVIWSLMFGFDSYMYIILIQKITTFSFLYISHIGGARNNYWASVIMLNSEYLHKRHHEESNNPYFGGFDIWYHTIVKYFPKKIKT